MSFFQKRENLILSGLVLGFFIILIIWHDIGGMRSRLMSGANEAAAFNCVFVDGNGDPHTLAVFKGTPMLVNFWATWCPVCVKKMDTVNEIAGKIEAAGGMVLNISSDQAGVDAVRHFYMQNRYNNLKVYLDPQGSLLQDFGGRGLPTAILIDANGNVVGRIEGGFDWSSQEAYNIIRTKLGLELI